MLFLFIKTTYLVATHFYCILFIVVKQYDDRKHVFNIAPQIVVLGFDWWVEKTFYRRKNFLVIGDTRPQVLAGSWTIAWPRLTGYYFILMHPQWCYDCCLSIPDLFCSCCLIHKWQHRCSLHRFVWDHIQCFRHKCTSYNHLIWSAFWEMD